MPSDEKSVSDYLSTWEGRLTGTLLDLAILYQAAFSQDIYPYSIKKKLEDQWGRFSPPLPTIYGTIKRLEKAGLIETHTAIIKSRTQKQIKILDAGWLALESMLDELKTFLGVFDYHEKELHRRKR